MEINQFNIRVYGLLINEGNILVTDEFRLGRYMTKFPGGGLQFGEGTIDCLKREFLEELHTHITIKSHFYTTDYYQPTSWLPSCMQLFNIYYVVQADKPFSFKTTSVKNDIPEVDGSQNFRWIRIDEMTEDDFTLPIDKGIVGKLRRKQNR
jgi:8-oxo-dGTP diphosphatase